MLHKLLEFKKQGFSAKQLFKIAKAIELDLEVNEIANIEYTPKEMDLKIEELQLQKQQ